MGFSTITSFVLMFFTVIILLSSATLIYSSLVENANTSASVQRERMDNIVNTRIDILSIRFDSSKDPDLTTIYLINDGSRKIDLEYVDVYIDEFRIQRDPGMRTISFVNDTNIANPLHWDPDEIIEINVSMDLTDDPHVAVVSTEYGVKDSKAFTYT